MKNIVLIGMPGSGKSSVAKIFAQEYAYKYIDSDMEIIKKAKINIPDIFKMHGENYFRELESEIIKNIPQDKNLIIALGGGCVTYKKNFDLIKKLGIVIYLFCRPNKIYKNLMSDKTNSRPLIQNYLSIKKLFSQRYNLYKNICDYIFDCNKFLSPKQTADKLICFVK